MSSKSTPPHNPRGCGVYVTPLFLAGCKWVRAVGPNEPWARAGDGGQASLRRETVGFEPYIRPRRGRTASPSGVADSFFLSFAALFFLSCRSAGPSGRKAGGPQEPFGPHGPSGQPTCQPIMPAGLRPMGIRAGFPFGKNTPYSSFGGKKYPLCQPYGLKKPCLRQKKYPLWQDLEQIILKILSISLNYYQIIHLFIDYFIISEQINTKLPDFQQNSKHV